MHATTLAAQPFDNKSIGPFTIHNGVFSGNPAQVFNPLATVL